VMVSRLPPLSLNQAALPPRGLRNPVHRSQTRLIVLFELKPPRAQLCDLRRNNRDQLRQPPSTQARRPGDGRQWALRLEQSRDRRNVQGDNPAGLLLAIRPFLARHGTEVPGARKPRIRLGQGGA